MRILVGDMRRNEKQQKQYLSKSKMNNRTKQCYNVLLMLKYRQKESTC